tara:strand:+ start:70 stop:519 length:450 start_codon:yes stop_codon:yes gene_type:complete
MENDNLKLELYSIINNIESKSWICNYLNKKGIIDNGEFMQLSRFGSWVLENYPIVMKCYWSYLDKLMTKFDKVETFENAKKIFRPWADETINFIKTNQLNRAYYSFCLLVIKLTEKYNNDYSIFTKQELDVYLGIKKSIENTKRYSYVF